MTIDPEKEHKWLIRGIMASIGFTAFVATWLWAGQVEIANDVDTILADVGYIKGVIESWDIEYQTLKQVVP